MCIFVGQANGEAFSSACAFQPILRFPKRPVLQITRVQSIHDKSLIYRDIKPDNFLIGLPGTKNANTIYVCAPLFLHLDRMPIR